ncbi:uncharacterized protein LOC144281356 isoform X2 [Canis aureus]
MSRLRGAPGLLRTCCEASRGCEAYSTVTGDLAYSGPADYDSGTHGATCALTGARLPQDPLEDTGGTVGATSMSEGTPQNHRTVEPKIANPRNHQKPTLMQTHEGLFTSSSLCPSIPDTVEQGLGPPGHRGSSHSVAMWTPLLWTLGCSCPTSHCICIFGVSSRPYTCWSQGDSICNFLRSLHTVSRVPAAAHGPAHSGRGLSEFYRTW